MVVKSGAKVILEKVIFRQNSGREGGGIVFVQGATGIFQDVSYYCSH